MIKKYLLVPMILLVSTLHAQQRYQSNSMTLEQAIAVARDYSPSAQMAQLSYLSAYWVYRSYKAQFLPSLNMYSSIGSYDRSLVEVRNTDTGEISYVANNSLTNSIGISIDQNIALTGGTVSLSTDLVRLDQFDYNNQIYTTNPLSITYSQPIRGFNTLKWQKETSPREYEVSKREYLETIEQITITVTNYFFAVLSAQNNYDKAVDNYDDTKRLYEIAQKRFDISSITKSELLQLELAMINAKMSIDTYKLNLDIAKFAFSIYLGIAEEDREEIEFIAPADIPNIVLDFDKVLDRALVNSAHKISQELDLIYAEMSVASAKADRGMQINFGLNLGLSQSASDFYSAYTSLKDREIVGLSFSMPIYDWGMSRGKVKMAEVEEQLVITQIEQAELEFVQDIRVKVMQFNSQIDQCINSVRARDIANERYLITTKRFETGAVTVTELNTALEEKDSANASYITQLSTFWNAYFEIQKLSLFDYIKNKDISTEFDKLI
ncbi:MAG: TolC family protein [Rikenellaceae bacterium]